MVAALEFPIMADNTNTDPVSQPVNGIFAHEEAYLDSIDLDNLSLAEKNGVVSVTKKFEIRFTALSDRLKA